MSFIDDPRSPNPPIIPPLPSSTGPAGPTGGQFRGPQPHGPAPVGDHVALTGNLTIGSMAAGGLTVRSDTPLPLRTVDSTILSNWDQPQPQLPQRSPPFVPGGPAEPPFPPPAAEGSFIIKGDQPPPPPSIDDFSVSGTLTTTEAPDTASIIGNVTPPRRTVIIQTVRRNQVAVHFNALSLLAEIESEIEAQGPGRSNSDIAGLEDLKQRVEQFLAANAKGDEIPIVDTTLSIADGLRRYWTEKYVNVCDIGLLGAGLAFCAGAGALNVSDMNIMMVGALAGGNRVADVFKAVAGLVWGPGNKDN
jgi:hypothetical protein